MVNNMKYQLLYKYKKLIIYIYTDKSYIINERFYKYR